MKFVELNNTQLQSKVDNIFQYMNAENAATGSKFDANANVSCKNIATLVGEIHKDFNIQINRKLMKDKMNDYFHDGGLTASQFEKDIKDKVIYVNDETSLKPYCVSVSMYPLLIHGLTQMGGESQAPKNLDSFCGTFINFVFAVASQFAGAVATVEFLFYMEKFIRQEYGDKWFENEAVKHLLEQKFQQIVYSINQPAAARDYQSVFWNISFYDRSYFESLFGDFVFPDGTLPYWEGLNELQMFWLQWINKEREKAVLTFPVQTVALLTENKKPKHSDFVKFLSKEMEQGNTFFVYMSDNADTLSSCCRLANAIVDNTFSYTLGAGGVATGSTKVITINFNRVIQKGVDLESLVERIHKYLVSHRKLMETMKANQMLPVYDAGFISLDKQYLTIGLNGVMEAAEFLGYTPSNNQEYKDWLIGQMKKIADKNKQAKNTYGYMFNTEFVPSHF